MGTVRATISLSSTTVMPTPVNIGANMTVSADSGTVKRVKILGTASSSNPVMIYKANDKLSNAYLYIKNLASEKEKYISIFADSTSDDPTVVKLGGGEFAFIPVNSAQTLKAFGTDVDQLVEFAVFGLDSSAVTLA
tara:strand:- start:935 stop:1342 length:408 start_codon:yes stop_codon:yes gene_type:complete